MNAVFVHVLAVRLFHHPARCILLVVLSSILLNGDLRGQQEPKVAVQVKTVSVFATVRDKHGKIVSNLSKNDFQVDEDGRPQSINYFAKESDSPLRLGLLADTSFSQRHALEQERSATYSFLDRLLRAQKDLAFVIKFDREVELVRDFTADLSKIQSSLRLLQTPGFTWSNGGGFGERSWGHGGGTLLYDAIFLASDELMSKQQGRKSLIVISDGVDRGSRVTVEEAIERTQRADTVVYSVLFLDQNAPGGGGGPYGAPKRHDGERADGKSILEEISQKTGGRLFQVSKKESLDKIYAEIEEELRSQYSLGYTPDKGAEPGYHKIRVTTKQKDLKVQARDGYYGGF
jgi:VWFA-related protein